MNWYKKAQQEIWEDADGKTVFVSGKNKPEGTLSYWGWNEAKDMQSGSVTKEVHGKPVTFVPPFKKRASSQKEPDPTSAVETIRSLGFTNPLNSQEILINEVKVNVTHYDDKTIWLKSIEAITPKQGHGTAVLQQIIQIADRFNVSIYLDPMPFNGMPNQKLVQWYKANGFVRGIGDFQHGLVHYPPNYKEAQSNKNRKINIDPEAEPVPVPEIDIPDTDYYDIHQTMFNANDAALNRVMDNFRRTRGRGRQPWTVVSLARVKKIWMDFMKYGFVRDEKGLNQIADQILENVAAIRVNTELAGHTPADPKNVIDDAGIRSLTEKQWERFYNWMDTQYGAPYSDYALDALEQDAIRIMTAKNSTDKLLAIDRLFNRVHKRGDLAALFIEKGRRGLNELYNQGLIRPPEKDRNLLSMNWYQKAVFASAKDYRPAGQQCLFEYHCYEGHDSSDADLWYRSHQPVTVVKLLERGHGQTIQQRCDNGHPAMYTVRFQDGLVKGVFEDELLNSEKEFTRPSPPKGPPTS